MGNKLVKTIGVFIVLMMLFVSIFGAIPVKAADNSAPVSKVSPTLAMRVILKENYLKKGNLPQGDISLPGGNIPASDAPTALNHEQVFIYFNAKPTDAQLNDLIASGVTPYPDSWIPPLKNHPTGFILADIPVGKLDVLSAKNYIMEIDTAEEQSMPQNDQAEAAMGVGPVWSGGDTGTGVTVAVLDSGIDTSNADFPLLNSTNSKDYSKYPILDDTITNMVTGHGSHVTGSVLGRGVNSATYKGVAPGANLVFLKIGDDTTGGAPTNAMVYAVRAAVDIYHANIITMSYGSWSTWHDGSSATSQAVDYAVSRGTTVFVSAGNDADKGWHYSGTVAANSTTTDIPITVLSGYSDYINMSLVWYDGLGIHNNLTLQYYNAAHVQLSSSLFVPQTESPRGTEANIFGFATLQSAGTYYLRVTNNSASSQVFQIYAVNKYISTFVNPDPNYTLGAPAEADSAIAVAAYVSRPTWSTYKGSVLGWGYTLDTIAPFSSRGPRVDTGAPNKPEITAPGSAIISVRDSLYVSNPNNDSFIVDDNGLHQGNSATSHYYVMSGTSMACPLAAGVGALLLSKNPSFTPAQIKNILETSATDKGTPGFDTSFGYGLINADAAVNPSVGSLSISTTPVIGASVDVPLATQPVILVRDQFGNPLGGVTVTASRGTGTGTLRGTLTAVSAAGTGLAAFTNLGYNKSGESFTIHFAAGTFTSDSGSLGPLVHGAATQVRVETQSNGMGMLSANILVYSSQVFPVYSISRDQYDNFIANIPADSWSLASITGGVVQGDLVAVVDQKSARFTAHFAGTAVIHAPVTGLNSIDSISVLVRESTVDHLVINTQPSSTLSVDSIFSTQPVVTAYDVANNPVSGVQIYARRYYSTGTGTTRGSTPGIVPFIVTNSSGVATFTNLGYDKSGEIFNISFTCDSCNILSAQVGPLAAGVATQIRVETAANGTGAVVGAQSLAAGSTLTVYSVSRDQFGNFVANAAADSWSLTGVTGGVAAADLVAAGNRQSATLTGRFAGTGVIHAAIASLTSTDSGTISVTSGSVNHLTINTQPASTYGVGSAFSVQPIVTAYDVTNHPVAGVTVVAGRDPATGTGAIHGTLSITTNGNGQAIFTDLSYDGTDIFKVRFTCNTNTAISNPVGPLATPVATSMLFYTSPLVGASVDTVFPTQPVIQVNDQFGRPMGGVTVTVSRGTGTGALRGTLTATSADTIGLAAFSNLGYNKAGEAFSLHFSAGAASLDSSTFAALSAGTAATISISSAPAAGATVDAVFATQPVILVADQWGNPVSGVTVAVSLASGTGTLRGTPTATSAVSTGLAAFSGLGYSKSGEIFTIHFAAGSMSTNSSSIGPIAAGAATIVRVETAANGSGVVVPAQDIYIGIPFTIYSVTRDQFGNFVTNAAADSWSLTSMTGGVVLGDLVASGDRKSAIVTGHAAGTAVIHTSITGLTVTDSGVINVLPGVVDHLVINTQPASSLSVDSAFNTAAVVTAYDVGNHPVTIGVNIVADRDPATGTGNMRGTLTATANGSGVATFSNLGYNETDTFKVRFTCQGKIIISNPVGPLNAGAATAITINTAPAAGASVDTVFTTQPVVLVADQFNNPVSGVVVTASRGTGTGTLRGTLTATSALSTGLATFTGLGYNKAGEAFTIHFAAGALTTDSGSLGALTVGAVATLTVQTVPVAGASVDAVFTTQPVILVTDQFSNPVSGVTVTASRGTGTGVLRGTLTAISAASTGLATFAGLGYNKSGEVFTIHFAAGSVSVNSGSISALSAGAATQVGVETSANGSGSVVGAQSLNAGSTLTVYSITRDQYNNFIANATPDSWTLTGMTGGAAPTDLVGSGASAVMTGHLIGTGIIHAAISGTASTDSGIITVTGGTVDHLLINTQPASTGTLDVVFTTQPTVTAYDIANNPVAGVTIVADRDPATGTGSLRGTLSVTTNASGQAVFTNLGYNRPDAFKVRFTGNTKIIISNQVAPLTVGTVAALTFNTTPVVGASVDAVFTTQPVILVSDQFSNPISGVTVTASRGTGTGVLRGTLTATSAVSTGLATFAGLGYNKSGEAFTIHFAAGTPIADSGSLGPLSAGTATQVRVETIANGSGAVVSAQSLTAGSTLTVYSITRDQYNNFIANTTPDSWSLTSRSGGVASTDLVGSGASAIMTGNLAGTGVIHAVIAGTASTDSGIITVTGGAVDHLVINTQPASTGTLDVVFTTQPTVTAYDIANNPVAGVNIVADRDPATGTGTLRGTLSVTTNASGQAVFTNLGYNRPDAFKVRFTGNTKIIISSQIGALTVGAVATLAINTAPVVGISVDAVLTTQPVILVTDQFNNPVSGVTVTASRGTGTGTLRGTLTATSAVSTGLATFAGLGYNKSGETFTIHFAAGTPIADSSSLGPLSVGAVTQVRVETLANGSGSVAGAQFLGAGSSLTVYSITRDQYNNFVANTAADSWSLTSRTGGVASTDLVGSGASAVMTGHLMGTGIIHAVISGATSTDSGIITVTGGAVDHLVINTQPASTGTLDVLFTTQPTVTAYDVGNNPVGGVSIVADRDPVTGTGGLRGTLSLTTNVSGQVTYTDLGYNRTDAFKVRFTCNTKTIISSQVAALTIGATSQARIETAANGTGSVVGATSLYTGSSLTMFAISRDQFGNFAGNPAGVWTIGTKTGGVTNGNLVQAADGKSAIFTGSAVGTAVIHLVSGTLPAVDSGIITISFPPPPPSDGGGGGIFGPTTVAGVTNISMVIDAQGVFTAQVNAVSDDNKIMFVIWNGTTVKTSDSSILKQISIIHTDTPPAFQTGANLVSLGYNFQPEGLTFNPAAIVRFSYDPALLPAGVSEDSLQIAYYDTTLKGWVTLPSTVDKGSKFITAQITHFSTYAVTYGVKPPPPVVTKTTSTVQPTTVTTSTTTSVATTTATTTTTTTTVATTLSTTTTSTAVITTENKPNAVTSNIIKTTDDNKKGTPSKWLIVGFAVIGLSLITAVIMIIARKKTPPA